MARTPRIMEDPDTGDIAVWNGKKWVIHPKESFPAKRIRKTTDRVSAGPGPVGLVAPEIRTNVRDRIETEPLPKRMVVEATPSIVGAAVGGAIGAPFLPPLGAIGGAMAGSTMGELFSQEVGFAPRSNVNLGLAAAGPALGGVGGRGLRLARRGTAFLARKSPPIRAAAAKAELEKATELAGSIGTRILAKQTGLMARDAKVLFRAARMNKAPLIFEDLPRTRAALSVLKEEAKDVASFPEGRQIIRTINSIQDSFIRGNNLTTERLGRVRQVLGAAIDRLESAAGVRLGSTKKLFASMSDDMDNLADPSRPVAGRLVGVGQRIPDAIKFRKAAGQRAKLEFAVKDLEGVLAKATRTVKGEGDAVATNFKQVLDRVNDLSNPKHSAYDKNFTTALKDELPKIKKWLQGMNEISATGPAGPGSIVYRGITANIGRGITAGIAGAIGFSQGGLVAGGAGAMIGAQMPEMITSMMLSPTGRKAMERLARMGKGQIDDKRFAVLGATFSQLIKGAEAQPQP